MIVEVAHPDVDATDPLVVMLAWLLTEIAGRQPWLAQHRHLLPMVAVTMAIGVRASIDAMAGSEITVETLARGFAAGAAAVFADVQRRQLDKARKEKR